MLDIKIYGPGCQNCIKLENLVKEVISELNIPANITKVTDRNEFLKDGIMMTPALVVNGKILSMGKIPVKVTLENWLKNFNS